MVIFIRLTLNHEVFLPTNLTVIAMPYVDPNISDWPDPHAKSSQ